MVPVRIESTLFHMPHWTRSNQRTWVPHSLLYPDTMSNFNDIFVFESYQICTNHLCHNWILNLKVNISNELSHILCIPMSPPTIFWSSLLVTIQIFAFTSKWKKQSDTSMLSKVLITYHLLLYHKDINVYAVKHTIYSDTIWNITIMLRALSQ